MDPIERLEADFKKLTINEMQDSICSVNNPPTFDGKKNDLESFITRVELAFESRPTQFTSDDSRIRFTMSFMYGKPLEWASCLKRNNSPILNSYTDFIRELRNNFGGFS